MTESIVRDKELDGVWHVYIDGFHVGDLWAQEQEDNSIRYGYSYPKDFDSFSTFEWLAEAESALVSAHKVCISLAGA